MTSEKIKFLEKNTGVRFPHDKSIVYWRNWKPDDNAIKIYAHDIFVWLVDGDQFGCFLHYTFGECLCLTPIINTIELFYSPDRFLDLVIKAIEAGVILKEKG